VTTPIHGVIRNNQTPTMARRIKSPAERLFDVIHIGW
jgi:hypothetical protein